jgi:hypothetical protein
MGLNISSDEFDHNYGKAVDHLPNITIICEDTLIYGKTKEECLEMTENFLKTCAENNITLNKTKVQWLTRTAWAVFKYCRTKTATLSISIRS